MTIGAHVIVVAVNTIVCVVMMTIDGGQNPWVNATLCLSLAISWISILARV